MNLLRRCRLRTLVLAALALAAFSLAEGNTLMLAAGSVLAAASWYALEGPRGRPLPRRMAWALGLLILGGTAAAGFGSDGIGGAITVTGRGLCATLVLMLFSRRSTVDERSVITLACGVIVAACLLSSGLLVGVSVAAATVAAVAAVMAYRLACGADAAAGSRRMPAHAHVAAPPPETPADAGSGPGLGGLTVASSALVLAISLAVFIVFPRLWREPGALLRGRGGAEAGFSTDIRLRSGDRISGSRREVFVVRWLDSAGQAGPFAGTPYLRGAVLDAYDPASARWTSSAVNPVQITFRVEPGEFANLGNPAVDTRTDTWTQVIEMRALVTDTMFTASAPVAVSAPAARTVVLEPLGSTLRDLGADDAGRYSTYQVKVRPYPSALVLERLAWGQRPREGAASFPVPEVREEALRILEASGLGELSAAVPPEGEARWERARRVAAAFDAWLQPPRFRYSTDLSRFIAREGRDPIDLFLRDYRFGHCELYASAMAALCRSVGVDARIVVGFIALEYDERAGVYVVRESNAHAWVEVLTGPVQWSLYDPTPAADLLALHESGRTWADSFRWLYDPLDFAWTRSVAGFDGSRQAQMADAAARRLSDALGEAAGAALGWAQRVNQSFLLGPAGYIWLGSVGMVVVVGAWAAVSVARARRRERALLALGPLGPSERRRMRRDARFWVDVVDALGRAGLSRPAHMTPVQWAQEIGRDRPPLGNAVLDAAHRLYAIRFGGERPDSLSRAADMARAAAVREAAAAHPR